MAITTIQWTATDGTSSPGYTFNPWRGCSKISDGCKNCYAETMSSRNPKVLGEWGPTGRRAFASEAYWKLPERWNREAEKARERRKVFCSSLADVFEQLPDYHPDLLGMGGSRLRLWDLIVDTPHLNWLLLTKRPENCARMVPHFWGVDGWPRNIWIGTSCENQEMVDARIPHLIKIPAAVRFLSCEPLLGSIDLGEWFYSDCETCRGTGEDGEWDCWDCSGSGAQKSYANALHWVIIGGESGPGARWCRTSDVRSLVTQCRDAGVPCFVKQLGSTPADHARPVPFLIRLRDKKGGDMAEWPPDLRVREFPVV